MATIVVVEDEVAIADAVAARLRSEGHEVEVAGDGPSAVALVERVSPDLVVLDVLLPGSTASRCAGGSSGTVPSRSSCSPPATPSWTWWSASRWAPTTT